MKLGKIVGSVVATRKDDRLVGHKLLVVQLLMPGREGYRPGKDEGGFSVAVDLVGSGTGDTVLLCTGSSARTASGDPASPIDMAVVGIVDTVDVDHREVL
ncbi:MULTISPECIES: EutN/CcmL family microcompartment protein [Aminiphilus]|jgi:ethanolamine utilization protein EutN|uniref:EutN/CcmL family microcompartment protein n=1 Tax=Aminiphilus TaxID=290731 RepID=UPI0004785757|nr:MULTISPECIES: EutN/CcmL family microcompartment protein [Aminiphilus]